MLRTAALASNLSRDSRPSSLDSTSSLAAVIIDCLDFCSTAGEPVQIWWVAAPRTRSTAYKQLCLSSHKLRGPRCLSSRDRTNRQFLARSSPLQAVSPEKDCAGQSFVARGAPACFGQPRAASARTTALTGSLSCKARPYKQLRKTAQGKAAWPARCLSCSTSTNGQFFARSSPLQAVSREKDSAGQSFVARGPPACFGQFWAASAKLAPIQAASQDSRAKLSHEH